MLSFLVGLSSELFNCSLWKVQSEAELVALLLGFAFIGLTRAATDKLNANRFSCCSFSVLRDLVMIEKFILQHVLPVLPRLRGATSF